MVWHVLFWTLAVFWIFNSVVIKLFINTGFGYFQENLSTTETAEANEEDHFAGKCMPSLDLSTAFH